MRHTTVRRLLRVVTTLALVSGAPSLSGQGVNPDSLRPPGVGRIQRLTLRDGSQLMGKVVSVGAGEVRFQSALGVSSIPVASIVSVREEAEGETRDGRYYFANPNATRLVFAPTGRQLKAGEGYFSD